MGQDSIVSIAPPRHLYSLRTSAIALAIVSGAVVFHQRLTVTRRANTGEAFAARLIRRRTRRCSLTARRRRRLGTIKHCLQRHPTHFEPSNIELDGIP